MCWTFGVSAVLTVFGLILSGFLAFKKRPHGLWLPLVYFSVMELLQAVTYFFINDCTAPANQLLTYWSYVHIAFQPFFVNMIMMQFIPDRVRIKIQGFVYAACSVGALLLLTKMYPFTWAGTCTPGQEISCGANLCAVSGNLHLAWDIPLNALPIGALTYAIVGFGIPLLYGAWKIAAYLAIGPTIAFLLTSNINEQPAVWCLFSIAFAAILLIDPLLNKFHVKKWYFWKYP